jgi:hypothetical protein
VDGASETRVFLTIGVPLGIPAMITSFLFSFVWYWNETYLVRNYLGYGSTRATGLTTLMLELNALNDRLCITFQLINKNRKPLELFCELLKQEGIPYSVSEHFTRHMQKIKLP